MKTSVASMILGFVVAVWLTPLTRRLALRLRLVDGPQDGRRINKIAIPRAGGLAIAAGVLAPILALVFYENSISHAIYENTTVIVVLLVGALGALGVGLADDLYRPAAKLRLLALVGIAVITWVGGHRVDEADLPWLGQITLGHWSLPVTVLWIVGVIVAFNFLDGLDGLATGIALISTVTLFTCALIDRNVLLMTWTGAMAGALLGFLVFNFNPASIFMGDAGSNFLGYLLAVVALQTSRKQTTAVSLLVPMLVLGLPLLDVVLTLVCRSLLRQGLFTSERGHLHHRLLQLGLSHRTAVLVLYAVTAVLCLGGLSIAVPLHDLHILVAVLMTMVIFSLMYATGYIHPRDLIHMYHQGIANETRQLRVETVCQELAERLQTASDAAGQLPQILDELVERGGVTAVQYRCERSCHVVAGVYDPSAKGTRLIVEGGRSGAAAVVVFWKDRAVDPTPRESVALRKLFAGLECSCMAAVTRQLDKVWAALVEAANKLSVLRIQLELDLPGLSEGFNATWEKAATNATEKSWRLDVPVMSETGAVGSLRVIGDSCREDIARLLDVLETSESYLESVFRNERAAPVAVAAPHFDLVRDRAARSTAKIADFLDGSIGNEPDLAHEQKSHVL